MKNQADALIHDYANLYLAPFISVTAKIWLHLNKCTYSIRHVQIFAIFVSALNDLKYTYWQI